MPLYVKVSTEIMADEKLNEAGPAASWLWLRGLCWSKERLTDGFVALGALITLCAGLGNPKKLANKLVEVGLWEECSGGFRLTKTRDGSDKWSKHQTTKDQVESTRDKWREIKRVQRGQRGVSTEDNRSVHRGQVSVSTTCPPDVRAPEPEPEPEPEINTSAPASPSAPTRGRHSRRDDGAAAGGDLDGTPDRAKAPSLTPEQAETARAIHARPFWLEQGTPWIDADRAARLARQPGITLEHVKAALSDAKAKRKILQNPAGYVIFTLEDADSLAYRVATGAGGGA